MGLVVAIVVDFGGVRLWRERSVAFGANNLPRLIVL